MTRHAYLGLLQVGLLALLGAVTVGGGARSEAAVRRALLSVDGLHVASADSIYDFHIETWGVEFLAVCTLPQSWALTSEKFENPEGLLSGKADLHGTRLARLTNMYLVDVYDYAPTNVHVENGEVPASFSGWIHIGSRERFGEWRGRRVTLKPGNFRLENAATRPTPLPAAP